MHTTYYLKQDFNLLLMYVHTQIQCPAVSTPQTSLMVSTVFCVGMAMYCDQENDLQNVFRKPFKLKPKLFIAVSPLLQLDLKVELLDFP